MKIITAILLLAVSLPPLEGVWENLKASSLLPWAKKIPITNYQHFIDLRLVKKDWLPKMETLPQGDQIIEKYPGPVMESYGLFKSTDYMYDYYERRITNGLELLAPEYGYDPTLPSIFVIHTISEDANKFFVRNTITALALRNFVKNYNVFSLNMAALQVSMQQSVWSSLFGRKKGVSGFGMAIGSFIHDASRKNLINLDQVHIISFCFSSQIAGFVGRYLSRNNNDKKIASILGMDPYSIMFSSFDDQVLTSKDAQIVHIYHTNSYFFGTFRRQAHADFVLNGGIYQPGCFKKSFFATMDCSHQRAVLILWYSILYPDLFIGRRCSSFTFFRSHLCNKNAVQSMTFPPQPIPKGEYFLVTESHKPYGMGTPGAE